MHWSYWEKNSFTGSYDVVIIGAGITGLSTAIDLKVRKPSMSIVVLERGTLPSGASTKNAGFACFGSISELLADEREYGLDPMLSLVEDRWKGLQLLRKNIGDVALDYQHLGGYEIFSDADALVYERCENAMHRYNQLLKPVVGSTVFSDDSASIDRQGLTHVSHMIKNAYEGQIDTGKMMKTLMQKAYSLEVDVRFGMEVVSLEESTVLCANGLSFQSNTTVVTTNGFAKKIVSVKVEPARAQVLITKPLSDFTLQGSFHYDAGFFYFRNINNRLLIGGGRNLDFEGEKTTEMVNTKVVLDGILAVIDKHILVGKKFEMDYCWSGIMGLGNDKNPIIKWLDDHTIVGVKLGGMGVAIGSLVGKKISDMILK